jgi:hypothetical protein
LASALNVPKADRAALTILRELPEDAFKKLVSDLENFPTVSPSIANVSLEDSARIFEAITSLHRVRAYSEVSINEFISDVCESLREHNDLPRSEEPIFRTRLAAVLSIEVLSIAGKAVALHTEYDNLFCSARILTDARPVYGADPSAPPTAMIIMHTLKLDYHSGPGGHISEFYVALGSHDINELHDVLMRAEKKAQSLATVIANAKVRLIDPQA